jgi:hypothetical protein
LPHVSAKAGAAQRHAVASAPTSAPVQRAAGNGTSGLVAAGVETRATNHRPALEAP